MESMAYKDWGWARKFGFITICAALAIGAFVSMLVNFLVSGHFTWSIIVLGAVGMAWAIIAPWFILERRRLITSWAAAAVSVPIFLYIVESLSPGKGWFLTLGLPSAAAGLATLGGIIWLWSRSRLKFWYAASLTFLFMALNGLIEVALVRPFVQPDPLEAVRIGVNLGLAGAAVLLALTAVSVHGFRAFNQHG